MPVFESFAAMKSYIEGQIKDALGNEIADMVDQTIREHAQSDVYDAYPQRGAYADKMRNLLRAGSNYNHDISGFSLTVTDETPGNTPSGYGHTPSGTELSDIIEHGLQGNGNGGWKDAFPRPYMANAQDEVIPKAVDILQSKFG